MTITQVYQPSGYRNRYGIPSGQSTYAWRRSQDWEREAESNVRLPACAYTGVNGTPVGVLLYDDREEGQTVFTLTHSDAVELVNALVMRYPDRLRRPMHVRRLIRQLGHLEEVGMVRPATAWP